MYSKSQEHTEFMSEIVLINMEHLFAASVATLVKPSADAVTSAKMQRHPSLDLLQYPFIY